MKARDELLAGPGLEQPWLRDKIIEGVLEHTEYYMQCVRRGVDDDEFDEFVDWVTRLKKECLQ